MEAEKKACVVLSGSDFFAVLNHRSHPDRDGRLALTSCDSRLRIEVGQCKPEDRKLVATVAKGSDPETRVVTLEKGPLAEKWYENLAQCESARVTISWEEANATAQARA